MRLLTLRLLLPMKMSLRFAQQTMRLRMLLLLQLKRLGSSKVMMLLRLLLLLSKLRRIL